MHIYSIFGKGKADHRLKLSPVFMEFVLLEEGLTPFTEDKNARICFPALTKAHQTRLSVSTGC